MGAAGAFLIGALGHRRRRLGTERPGTSPRQAGEERLSACPNNKETRMRLLFPVAALLLSTVALQACAPAYENGHLSRFINRQREARDACLRQHVGLQDDRVTAPNDIARAIAATCAPENDRLIQAMATADPSGEPQITDAVRKEAAVKAESYVLQLRARPDAKSVPLLN
jgi:hypothetical protein